MQKLNRTPLYSDGTTTSTYSWLALAHLLWIDRQWPRLNLACALESLHREGGLNQRILEHLEWKLLGDFSKSKTIGDSKEAL